MKTRYTWGEIQERVLANMHFIANQIDNEENENIRIMLNGRLATANSVYNQNKEMIMRGEPCPYINFENDDEK